MSLTVLIVDDEAMPRAVLKDHIPWTELSVSQVFLAADGEEGIEQARKNRPEIIISDIKMPRRNGLEMAEAVRKFLPDCQFIFLSGYSDKDYLKAAIRVRAASYVEKPIDLEEMTAALREAVSELERRSPSQEETLFFRGIHAAGKPVNQAVFTGEKSALSQLEKLIRSHRPEETAAALNRIYAEISRCEGTSAESLRHLYCQIVLLFLRAAERHNIRSISTRADELLYTAVRRESLAGLWEILRQTAREYFEALDPASPDLAAQVENYLESHYQHCGLTVQSVAGELGFANSYLCAAYKKSSGKIVNQRLTEIRLHHAREMLAEGNRKLYQIAKAVGYADGKYFVKLFTRELGISPRDYRRRLAHEE